MLITAIGIWRNLCELCDVIVIKWLISVSKGKAVIDDLIGDGILDVFVRRI